MESGQPERMHPAEGAVVRPRLDCGRAGDGGGGWGAGRSVRTTEGIARERSCWNVSGAERARGRCTAGGGPGAAPGSLTFSLIPAASPLSVVGRNPSRSWGWASWGGTSPLLPSAHGPCQGEGRAKSSCTMNCGAFDYHTCLAT